MGAWNPRRERLHALLKAKGISELAMQGIAMTMFAAAVRPAMRSLLNPKTGLRSYLVRLPSAKPQQ
jgi:hypothetical protein